MSRYEWESGSLKIPAAEWVRVRRELIKAWNEVLQARFALAQQLHTHLTEARKGQRKFDLMGEAQRWAEALSTQRRSLWQHEDVAEAAGDAWRLVLKRKPDSGAWTLQAPKKKDVPFANSTTRSFASVPLYGWEGSVTLNDSTRTLGWSVSENNHAVERAWADPMGMALGRILASVKWTRGTGGVFVGNNEYNRDSRDEGGGGNLVTRRFGPLGAPQRVERWY